MISNSPFLENIVKKTKIVKELEGCLDEFEKANENRLSLLEATEVDPNQYSPFLEVPFFIYCGKDKDKKLLVGKPSPTQEPVVIDNSGVIHRFATARHPSASGRFYKAVVAGQGPQDIVDEGRINLGEIFGLPVEQFAVFYIYSQTDKEGTAVSPICDIWNVRAGESVRK